MDGKKYVCVSSYDNFDDRDLIGTAKTIDEWKDYLIDDRKKALNEVFYTTDKDFIEQMNDVIQLKEDEVIPYIKNNCELKLVPYELAKYKYLIVDESGLYTEDEIRKMLLVEETNDILSYPEDYVNNGLDIDYQCECIKKAVKSPIEEVLKMLNENWNIPVIKIKGV